MLAVLAVASVAPTGCSSAGRPPATGTTAAAAAATGTGPAAPPGTVSSTGSAPASGPATTTPAPRPSAAAPAPSASPVPVRTPPAGVAADATVCPSARLVVTALRVTVSPPVADATGDVLVCRYPATSDPSRVVLRVDSAQDAAGFATDRARVAVSGTTTITLPGFFDGAWTSLTGTGPSARRTVAVRRGTTAVLVTSAASLDAEKRLLGTLLD